MLRKMVKLSTIIVFFCCSTYASAEEGDVFWMISGVQYGGLLNSGTVDNRFEEGTGFIGEIGFVSPSGWSFVFYGTSAYWAKNQVHNDEADVRFYSPYYTEIRRFFGSRTFCPFLGVGFAWSRMHFEKTKGADNQYLILLGGGLQVRLGRKAVLQGMIKRYRVYGNALGQDWGMEAHLGIGFTWHPK